MGGNGCGGYYNEFQRYMMQQLFPEEAEAAVDPRTIRFPFRVGEYNPLTRQIMDPPIEVSKTVRPDVDIEPEVLARNQMRWTEAQKKVIDSVCEMAGVNLWDMLLLAQARLMGIDPAAMADNTPVGGTGGVITWEEIKQQFLYAEDMSKDPLFANPPAVSVVVLDDDIFIINDGGKIAEVRGYPFVLGKQTDPRVMQIIECLGGGGHFNIPNDKKVGLIGLQEYKTDGQETE
jgi:hypothetical protein